MDCHFQLLLRGIIGRGGYFGKPDYPKLNYIILYCTHKRLISPAEWKRGLVLDGGGGKGGYQIGVCEIPNRGKLLYRLFIRNFCWWTKCALILQGDYDKAYNLWSTLENSKVKYFNSDALYKLIYPFIKELIKIIGLRGSYKEKIY
ncbi:MAG: hypothetical protein U5K71_01710 [Gracilimonas sp.]|nr:hypothetical protein [Gracilimonas sp.]